jgi:hypothetical protein
MKVSALSGVGLVLFVEAHGALLDSNGAGDESTRSDHAGEDEDAKPQ